jgi:citrate lyase subunit beta / citryl-CoA lyase
MAMRSILCVPANRQSMVEKSSQYQSYQVILDLEDAVVQPEKASARKLLSEFFHNNEFTTKTSVRINEITSAESFKDLDFLAELDQRKLWSVIIPKVDSLDSIARWVKLLPPSIKIEAQIESAMGLISASEIASHPQVISLAFGPVDFMHSIGMPSGEPGIPESSVAGALQWPLLQIVIAAHAHGKLAYDGPFIKFSDEEGFAKSVEISRALGADGKWLIHPNQIASCNEIFSPSDQEIEKAKRVIDAFGSSSGAASLDGLMIDEASRKLAEQILGRATQIRK